MLSILFSLLVMGLLLSRRLEVRVSKVLKPRQILRNNKTKQKSNSWKITLLQRELFLTMFNTINLSPLLVIKKGFMIIIILSN